MKTRPKTKTLASIPGKDAIKPATDLYPKVSLVKAKNEANTKLAKLPPVIRLPQIKTAAQYQAVDNARTQIQTDLKWWKGKLNPAIEGIRAGLDILYEVRKEVEDKFKADLALANKLMVDYKTEERRVLAEAEEAKLKEQRRLNMIAEANIKRASMVKGSGARNRLLDKAAEIQVKAEELEVETEALEADNSQDIATTKCRVYSLRELIKHVAKLEEAGGKDLTSLLQINQVELNALFALDEPKIEGPKTIGSWLPGVEVYEHITIKSRRSA